MTANLLLHQGSAAVDRDTLAAVPTPDATDTWQPIPHIQLVETVESVLDATGLEVAQQAHGVTHDGRRYFGLLELRNGHNSAEYARVLGLRNANDKAFAAGVCAGSQVLVCDNLCFAGEITVARKHTRFLLRDLQYLIREAMSGLMDAWRLQDQRIHAYKNRRITNRTAHDLTIRALDERVVPASRIPKVIKEWRKPSHDAFRPRNVWSWFNAITESFKGSNLQTLPARTTALHKLCDSYVGLS